MAEDIKSLIEKINQEGVLAAEEKARAIEEEARLKAEQVLREARLQAQKLLSEAEENISKMQEKEKGLIAQAGRDMILALRQEINSMLEKLIDNEVKSVLTPENMFSVINNIIMNSVPDGGNSIVVSLNKDDLRLLEDNFIGKLKEEAKKKVVLRAANDIRAGFTISFDAGKSQFDFSDKALAEYIGNCLKPKLKEILQVK